MNKTESIAALAAALAASQGKFPAIKRTQKVDFTTKSGAKIKYSYAPLADILEACRKPLAENGLAIAQFVTSASEGKLTIETLLAHSSGEWVSESLSIAGNTADPQAIGSLITYTRRYTLSAMLGLAADEDDDAQTAMPDSVEPRKADPGHWCTEHNTPFFRKGKMKTFAHPIGDSGQWCNEEEKPEPQAAAEKVESLEVPPNFGDGPALTKWFLAHGLSKLDIQAALNIKTSTEITDTKAASEILAKIKAAREMKQ